MSSELLGKEAVEMSFHLLSAATREQVSADPIGRLCEP